MKTHKLSKAVAVLLSVLMIVSIVPMTAFASEWSDNNVVFEGNSFGTNGYYTVISKNDWTLVPGAATETEMVLNNSAGNRRQVMHIIEVDPSNPDVSIVPGYYGIDKDVTDVNNQKAAGVTDVAKYYEEQLGYNVVAAMNTDLYYEANAPRVLVYNGKDMRSGRNTSSVLCVYKDSNDKVSCVVKPYVKSEIDDELANGNAEKGQLIQAVSVSFGMTVKDGVLVKATEERTTSTAARSMVGVKEDGTLVLVMNDGRGANNSVGFNDYELGESMLALGCKWAANCDGGGSSSIVTRRVGETTTSIRCVPCDGAERPTIHSVMVVSNVGPTGELDSVNINSDYNYFAPGISYDFTAEAIDTHGYSMDIPADASWSLSDASYGTVNNGKFVSNGTTGDVDVQVESGGKVVGKKTIHVANPTTMNLSASETTLPYSTTDKVRTITLPMVAKIGENNVYTSGAYNISVSPANGGTVDGLKFTATDDTSVAKATVSIKYVPTNQEFTYNVNYGKGSEILWDFEDGDVSDWVSTAEADKYMRDNGAELATSGDFTTPFRTLFAGGQISWSNTTSTALSSVANGGKAHGGDKALAVTFDMKNVEFNSWVYSIIWNKRGNTVLRDVANGKNATAFGCWVYVPKGFYTAKNNGAQALQLTVQKGPNADTLTGTQLNLQYNGKNINALKEADIPENRWVYVKADLTTYNYVKLVDPVNDVYRSPSFIRMYVKPSEAQEMTYYFDDWTLDYSSAVDDREPPVISNATYCTNDTNIDFNDQTITTNVVSFDANVADYEAANAEGLDYSSAKIYVDGVAQANVRASGKTMGVQNVVLSNGVHNITFEIADNLGNATTLTKKLTVKATSAKSAVRLSGHNDKNNGIEAGSVYYVDVTADAIENIDTVETTVELQSAHEWELDHMSVADGFEASYELNSVKDNIATVTITKTGETSLTGEQTLVSLPARVWSFNENTMVGGDSSAAPVKMTATQRYNSKYGEPLLMMEANVLYGEVKYTDDSMGTFGGSISKATEVTGNKTKVWHEHNAEPVDDKAATCTEDGFSGRTYCDECGSVVDWGTTVKATGHNYEFIEGILKCTNCDETFTGTWTDGKEYINGVVPHDGWNGDYYFVNGKRLKGIQFVDEAYYDFGDDGKSRGKYTGLFEENGDTYYAIAGNKMHGWHQIGDDWYYFRSSTYKAAQGVIKFNFGDILITFEFDNGRMLSGQWVETSTGTRYYNGPVAYTRTWAEIDGKKYYFDENSTLVRGYFIIKDSRYSHDDDYRMYKFNDKTGVLEEAMTSTGLLVTDNGTYYLDNGYAKHGLFKVGNDYYYFNSTHKAVTGNYYVGEEYLNGLDFKPGYYDFDENGKLIDKNGIYDIDGTLYYLVHGEKTYAGIIELDGAPYYVHSDATGKTWVTKTNDKVEQGYYLFADDGKMINTGIFEEDGTLYYYEGGKKTYAGLTDFEGATYYVHSDGRVATGETWVTKTNDKVAQGYYRFAADGKMIDTGIFEEDGKLYYYEGGKKTYAGIIELEGATYYVHSDGRVATGETWVTKTNGKMAQGYYLFAADGKMIDTGVYEVDGTLYYFENGKKTYAGIVKVGDDYYYAHSQGNVATSETWVTKTNGIVDQGYYLFGADGKMVHTGVYDVDGTLYYFENGKKTYAGLVMVGDDYYYVHSQGNVATGKTWVTKTNGIVSEGYYNFGDDGKMILD